MIDDDKKEFAEILGTVMSLYGKDATKPLLLLYWNALARFTIGDVRTALNIWVQDPKQGTFMPKPADIIRTIGERLEPQQPKWISANEAWAIALPAADEAETVVWTQEIAKAWAISKPILEAGDKVGARMAFIPAYERFVESARNEGRLPQFEISAGWDADRRDRAVTNAVTAGILIDVPKAQQSLPAPTQPNLFQSHVVAYQKHKISQMPDEQKVLFDESIPIPERMTMLSKYLAAGSARSWGEQIKATEQAQKIHQAKRDEIIRQLQEQS